MTEDQIKEGIWVKLKHFPKIPEMIIVKNLQNTGWWGARYQAEGKIMVYGEYHLNELELAPANKKQPYIGDPTSYPKG